MWEQGLADSPIRLLARYPSSDPTSPYFVTAGSPVGPCLILSLPLLGVWTVATLIVPPADHPNFPWGWDVEPDRTGV